MSQTTSDLSGTILRPGKSSDAEPCARICFEAFKSISETHGFPADFTSVEIVVYLMDMLFSRPEIYSVVAADNEGVVCGSNFLKLCGSVGGIGPITVDTSVQNHGVGRRLMENVIEYGLNNGLNSLRLVQAAFHNRSLSLYTKLGFNVVEPLSVMQGPAIGQSIPGFTVRPATSDDISACAKLHYCIHGFHRGNDLEIAVSQGTATLVEHAGRITGYATALGFTGYAVGETNEDLKALISAAASFHGSGFLLPSRNSELFRWCLQNGLRIIQPMSLMSMGLYKEPSGAFLPSILF